MTPADSGPDAVAGAAIPAVTELPHVVPDPAGRHAGLRLLAVHAHPDDESSKAAATTARYVAEGAQVLVVSCTGGEGGEVLNPHLLDAPGPRRDMARVRRQELREARDVLGFEQIWLGYVDSGMTPGSSPYGCFAEAHLPSAVAALTRVVRAFRPHVMVAYDERGGYPHPDHLMAHRVAMGAFEAAGDPTYVLGRPPAPGRLDTAGRPAGADAPWQPLKLYYVQITTKERVCAFHQGMLDLGLRSPYEAWVAGWDDAGNRHISTRMPCGAYYRFRDAALLAHASQIDPAGEWFAIPTQVQEWAWPTEDFEAVLSYVPVVDGEDCLFARIGRPQEADALAIRAAGAGVAGAGVVPLRLDRRRCGCAQALVDRSGLQPAPDPAEATRAAARENRRAAREPTRPPGLHESPPAAAEFVRTHRPGAAAAAPRRTTEGADR